MPFNSRDEIAEFVGDLLKQLAIIVGISSVPEDCRATLNKPIALFEDHLAGRKKETAC